MPNLDLNSNKRVMYNNTLLDRVYLGNQLIYSTAASDPYINNVFLFLKGDGANNSTNIVDSSPTPKTITVNGATKISTTQSKYGGSSIYNDRTTSSLSNLVALGTTFNLDQDYTIELWTYPLSISNGGATIKALISNHNASFLGGFRLAGVSGGYFIGLFTSGGATVFNPSLGTGVITLNSWSHHALTRSGNVYRYFINGIQVYTATSSTVVGTSLNNIIIGGHSYSTNGAWDGYIDSVRVTLGIARYTANFNPETDTYLA